MINKMKNIWIVLLLLLPLISHSQSLYEYDSGYFGIKSEVDAYNLAQMGEGITGYNGTLEVNYRMDGMEFGLFTEIFPNRDFLAVGVNINGVLNREGKVNYLGGIGLSLINRTTENLEVYHANSFAVNGQIGYHISNVVYISARLEHRYRGDIKFLYGEDADLYVTSVFLGTTIKLN
jgi:hypothetical protein